MLTNRINGILTCFSSPISNGPAEGFNTRLEAIKSVTGGFCAFEHYTKISKEPIC
jgi:transposase